MKKRLDEIMVVQNLVTTRSQARHLIKDGAVICNNSPATKPGQLIAPDSQIEIKRQLYVSRGAYKIESAINNFNIDPKNKVIADIGASTGGFSDFLLQKKAQKIFTIDVGHNQLHPKIKNHPNVQNFEGINVKKPFSLPEKVDFCVIDLSFISLKLILKNLIPHLKENGFFIALFKPQFEGQPSSLNQNGLVKSNQETKKILLSFENWLNENNFHQVAHFPCPIKGKTGNQEFFFLITTKSPPNPNNFNFSNTK